MNKKVRQWKKKPHTQFEDGMQFLGFKMINFITYSNHYKPKNLLKFLYQNIHKIYLSPPERPTVSCS